MSLSQSKIEVDPPAYMSFTKKNKKSILMNKMQIDSGYPQDIFAKQIPHKDLDYVEDNKKNLKNFFKDRLPHDQVKLNSLNVKSANFDPMRMFQIKRQQFQLKSQTKIILNGGFLNKAKQYETLNNKSIGKISQMFLINDKTLEFKKKYGSSTVKRNDSQSKDNYRRGTRSFMEKRSKILKRQAYEKVFGPNISSISRTLPVTPNVELQLNVEKSYNKKPKSRLKSSSLQPIESKRQELSKLIHKIDEFKDKIKPRKLDYREQDNTIFQNSVIDQNQQKLKKLQEQQKQHQKKKVLSMIQNITNVYKDHAIQDNREKLSSLQDLERIDSAFYTELNNHKKTRLQKRMYELYKYSIPQSNELIKSKLHQEDKINNVRSFNGKNRRHQSDILTVTENTINGDQEIQSIEIKRSMEMHERFRFLGKHLIKASLQANFYMVDENHFCQAFWEHREPFQMEGSYAFYKAIKMDDIDCVKTFINIDLNYLYERDSNGNTPLLYATIHNKTEIALYFLQKGSNVDKLCKQGKPALYYALYNKNLEITTGLLQYGASPWSTKQYSYRKLLEQIDDKGFSTLFSNARKIFLAVKLQVGNKKRSAFWHENKHRIAPFKIIQF